MDVWAPSRPDSPAANSTASGRAGGPPTAATLAGERSTSSTQQQLGDPAAPMPRQSSPTIGPSPPMPALTASSVPSSVAGCSNCPPPRPNPFSSPALTPTTAAAATTSGPFHDGDQPLSFGDDPPTMSSIERAINRLSRLPPDFYGNSRGGGDLCSRRTSLGGPGGLHMLNAEAMARCAANQQVGDQQQHHQVVDDRPLHGLNTSYSLGALQGARQDDQDYDESGCSSAAASTSRRSNLSAQSAPDRIQLKRKHAKTRAAGASRMQSHRRMSSTDSRVDDLRADLDLMHERHLEGAAAWKSTGSGAARRASTAANLASLRRDAQRSRSNSVRQQVAAKSANGGKRKLGPLKVTETTYGEVVAYKRSLVLLALAFLYTLFALSTVVFKSRPADNMDPSGAAVEHRDGGGGAGSKSIAGGAMGKHSPDDGADPNEWTQEQVAGWHRDHKLVLSDEYLELFRTAGNIRIRECHSGLDLSASYMHLSSSAIDGASGAHVILSTPSLHQLNLTTHSLDLLAKVAQRINSNSTTSTTTTTTISPGSKTGSTPPTRSIAATGSARLHISASTSTTTTTTSTTTRRPTRKPKRKFAALNGCLFRRDTTSDSLGDLCCCSGIPRYTYVNVTTINVVTTSTTHAPPTSKRGNGTGKARESKTTTVSPKRGKLISLVKQHRTATTKNGTTKVIRPSSGTSTTTTTTTERPNQPELRKKYLRPHLMCFVSASGALFNAQKMVAPLVSEQTLKNANLKSKGKCIPCSCCHEHEPEMVNKLLANVALDKQTLSGATGGGGEDVIHLNAKPSQESASGVWVYLRAKLVDSMRDLDDFLFRVYDMLDLALFSMRFGAYPIENLHHQSTRHDSQHPQPQVHDAPKQQQQQQESKPQADPLDFALNVVPLRVAQQFMRYDSEQDSDATSRLNNIPTLIPKAVKSAVQANKQQVKAIRAKEATLMIDADAYDDFKPTTTTTRGPKTTTASSTSTTGRPSKRRMEKVKGRRGGRRGRKRRPTTTSGPLATSVNNNSTRAVSLAPSTLAPSGAKIQSNNSSSTTKGPTVIINVYAAANNGASPPATSARPAQTTISTTSRSPKIALITGQSHQLGAVLSGGTTLSKSSSDFKLQIELRPSVNATTPAGTTIAPQPAHVLVSGSPAHSRPPAPTIASQASVIPAVAKLDDSHSSSSNISNGSVLLTIGGSSPTVNLGRPVIGVGGPANMTDEQRESPRTSSRPVGPPSIVISLGREHQPTATITINTTHLAEAGETISAATPAAPRPANSTRGKLAMPASGPSLQTPANTSKTSVTGEPPIIVNAQRPAMPGQISDFAARSPMSGAGSSSSSAPSSSPVPIVRAAHSTARPARELNSRVGQPAPVAAHQQLSPGFNETARLVHTRAPSPQASMAPPPRQPSNEMPSNDVAPASSGHRVSGRPLGSTRIMQDLAGQSGDGGRPSALPTATNYPAVADRSSSAAASGETAPGAATSLSAASQFLMPQLAHANAGQSPPTARTAAQTITNWPAPGRP